MAAILFLGIIILVRPMGVNFTLIGADAIIVTQEASGTHPSSNIHVAIHRSPFSANRGASFTLRGAKSLPILPFPAGGLKSSLIHIMTDGMGRFISI